MASHMFRFTIRDVLWLTAIVAIVAGWTVDHARARVSLGRANFALSQQDVHYEKDGWKAVDRLTAENAQLRKELERCEVRMGQASASNSN